MSESKYPDPLISISQAVVEVDAIQLPSGMRKVTIRCNNIEDAMRLVEDVMTTPTVQQKNKHTYQLLAYFSGAAFLISILCIAVFIPNPTPFQTRVFLSVLALSAGAFGVVITGLLDIKASVGKQLTIGATGALALVVLMLFFDPTN
jgi:uncharacterized membrane protein